MSRSHTQSPEDATTSATDSDTDSEAAADGCAEHYCFYKEHLVSKGQNLDENQDYFLVEHLNAGHLTPCNPLSIATADVAVLTAPIREELPFDQVHFPLESVDIRQKLLSPRHIRLLKLYPRTQLHRSRLARKSSPLRCEVYQASLDDLTTDGTPFFAAASYVCGDQTHAKHIQCGREAIGIPLNVYDVLRHLRFENRPRLVWIDYLCIKQRDAREKSHQVRMLHRIYAQAHVVSWLGTGIGMDLNLVVFYLLTSARLWIEAVRANQTEKDLFKLAAGPVGHMVNFIDSQVTVRPHQRAMQALSSIANATYFRRVWILQEFVLGKTKTCQIGDTLHSVAVLAAAALALDSLVSERLEFHHYDFEIVLDQYFTPALHNEWRSYPVQMGSHDADLVTTASRRFCSDPRDYIYGVTSLLLDPDAYIVDYTLSVAEVFADFTIHCLSIDRDCISVLNQERLAMYAGDPPINLRSDLPSWCPDWSVYGGGSGILFDRERQAGFRWHASGVTEAIYTRPSRITLTLRGFTASILESCSASTLERPQTADDENSQLVWLERGASLCDLFKLQGLQVDHNSKDMILRAFDRILHPWDLRIGESVLVSNELRFLLDRADRTDLISLLAPLYLAKADPELFKVAGFQIDKRIAPKEYASIVGAISASLWYYSQGTRLFFTDGAMMSAGYSGVRQGDLVCIIYGSSTPQILRRTDEEGHFMLIGACNVDGLMFGEGLGMGLPEQDFILV